jgi:DNA-binding SARP family transcriptional activator
VTETGPDGPSPLYLGAWYRLLHRVVVDLAPQDDRCTGWTGASGLHVEMLGRFEVRVDGRDVTEALVGRSRSVFQYLVLTAAPVPRDVLIDVCWPEFDVERGRNNLNVAITGIRRALGYREIVRHRGGAYRIDPDIATWVDVNTFTELLQEAHRLDGDRAEAAIVLYRQAAALYRGELLPEARYCEWLEPRRRFLVHAHLDAVKRLAALCRDKGNLFEAAWAAQLGLLVDDLDEELVESWLQTLSDRRANRRLDAALRSYSDRLEEELGVRPSDRLLALGAGGRRAG